MKIHLKRKSPAWAQCIRTALSVFGLSFCLVFGPLSPEGRAGDPVDDYLEEIAERIWFKQGRVMREVHDSLQMSSLSEGNRTLYFDTYQRIVSEMTEDLYVRMALKLVTVPAERYSYLKSGFKALVSAKRDSHSPIFAEILSLQIKARIKNENRQSGFFLEKRGEAQTEIWEEFITHFKSEKIAPVMLERLRMLPADEMKRDLEVQPVLLPPPPLTRLATVLEGLEEANAEDLNPPQQNDPKDEVKLDLRVLLPAGGEAEVQVGPSGPRIERCDFLYKIKKRVLDLQTGVTSEVERERRCKTLSVSQCLCQHYYCSSHRLPHMHACPIDRFERNRERLTLENPKIIHEKFERMS